jgi:hypothetical protein
MSCSTGGNLHKAKTRATYGPIVGFVLCQNQTEVTDANALLEATWTAKYNAIWGQRSFPLFITEERQVTREKSEMVMIDTNIGRMIKSANGKRSYQMDFGNLPICHANKIKYFDGLSMYAFAVFNNGYVGGIDTATGIKPFPVQIFVDEYDNGENIEDFLHLLVKIDIVQRNNWLTEVAEITAFDIINKEGVINLELTSISGTQAGSTVTFTVGAECDDCYEITTLATAADWAVEAASTGVVQYGVAISNNNTVYTITGITLVAADTYYLYRKTADAATDKGFETRLGSVLLKTSFVAGA